MFNIYFGEELIGSYPEEREPLFQVFCRTHQVPQVKNKEGDYLLFPQLAGTVLAVSTVDKKDTQIEQVVKRLAVELAAQGAQIFYTPVCPSYNKLLRIMKVHIHLHFTQNETGGDKGKVRLFYSLRHEEESLQLIASIIKQLAVQDGVLNYEVPGLVRSILTIKYLKYYLADLPTVVVELNTLDPDAREYLCQAILEGLLQVYGNRLSEDQFGLLQKLTEALQVKPVMETEEVTKVEEVTKTEEVTVADQEPEPGPELKPEPLENTRTEIKTTPAAKPDKGQAKKKNPVKTGAGKPCQRIPAYPVEGPVFQFKPSLGEEVYSKFSLAALSCMGAVELDSAGCSEERNVNVISNEPEKQK